MRYVTSCALKKPLCLQLVQILTACNGPRQSLASAEEGADVRFTFTSSQNNVSFHWFVCRNLFDLLLFPSKPLLHGQCQPDKQRMCLICFHAIPRQCFFALACARVLPDWHNNTKQEILRFKCATFQEHASLHWSPHGWNRNLCDLLPCHSKTMLLQFIARWCFDSCQDHVSFGGLARPGHRLHSRTMLRFIPRQRC